MKEFLCRYGLLNGKYLSIFLGGFAGGEELHKIKQSRQNGNRQRASKIRVKYLLKSLVYEIILWHEKFLKCVYIEKCFNKCRALHGGCM